MLAAILPANGSHKKWYDWGSFNQHVPNTMSVLTWFHSLRLKISRQKLMNNHPWSLCCGGSVQFGSHNPSPSHPTNTPWDLENPKVHMKQKSLKKKKNTNSHSPAEMFFCSTEQLGLNAPEAAGCVAGKAVNNYIYIYTYTYIYIYILFFWGVASLNERSPINGWFRGTLIYGKISMYTW